jgi:uncharacterized protein YggE
MKKLILALMLGAMSFVTFAQVNTVSDRRIIQVSGEAEREVTPDILYLSISLKEYFKDSRNTKKVTIDELEKQLHDAAMKAGVAHEDFMINNISSYNYDWNKKKNDPGFLAAKQYRIKVTNLSKVNSLFAAMDPKGVQYSNVDAYEYSGKKELEKELKIQAIKDAKARASYMAEALGDQVGKALSVSESGYVNYPQPVYKAYRANVMMAEAAVMDDVSLDIDFKKVKFSYTVNVVFELK